MRGDKLAKRLLSGAHSEAPALATPKTIHGVHSRRFSLPIGRDYGALPHATRGAEPVEHRASAAYHNARVGLIPAWGDNGWLMTV